MLADGGQTTVDNLSYCISSRYRMAVLDALEDGAATPSTIAEEQGVGMAHVSRALQRLRERELVELIVPDDRKKGRLYELADDGADLLDQYGDELDRNRGGD
nr:helix-turn-helix domain-containing protein [Halosimplex pelagicum]